jgi:ABC-type antimicrobial peptide transport system permease subunit
LIYNSAIFFPISTVSTRITGQSHYSQIIVVISDSSLIYEKQDELDKLLKKELKIANQNTLPYKISNQAKMLDYIEDAMATMTILLAGIASISLLV